MNRGKLTCAVLAQLFCGFLGTASATDYYVSSVWGDDANPGTSAEKAWKSLAPVNAKVFEPGDRILFGAGSRFLGQLKPQGSGAEGKPIIIDKYGEGPLPRFDGEGKVEATVYLFNIEYWEVQNIEVSNSDLEPSKEKGRRNGIYVHINNFGTAHHIHLKNLHVRDVHGWGGHGSDSGDGIAWQNEGKEKPSRFDGLRIEGCHIVRTHLNGIWGFSQHWIKEPWVPNLNVVIRDNLLEDLGSSGIVPVGCDGALVEYNRVIRPSRKGGGIGIWPWSCDNTVIQYNEVSGSDGVKDGQAFDSDWNCRNTVFQDNYSHDNKGGFMLVCTTSLHQYNIGCIGTVIRYNVSENDGGTATHVFHIAGPCENTYIYNNTFYIGKHLDVNLIEHMNWEGYAKNTYFYNNAVYVDGRATFRFLDSTNNVFANNAWFGNVVDPPGNPNGVTADPQLTGVGAGGAIDDPRKLATLAAYRLQDTSPLIDRGADLKAILGIDMGTRDYFGNKTPAGSGYDIGAHEYAPANK